MAVTVTQRVEGLQHQVLVGGGLVAVSLLLLAAPEGIAPPPILSAAGVAVGALEVLENG